MGLPEDKHKCTYSLSICIEFISKTNFQFLMEFNSWLLKVVFKCFCRQISGSASCGRRNGMMKITKLEDGLLKINKTLKVLVPFLRMPNVVERWIKLCNTNKPVIKRRLILCDQSFSFFK